MNRPHQLFVLAICWASLATAARADDLPTVRAVDLGGLETRTAALMLSAQEAGDLDVSVVALPLPGEAGTSRVLLQIRLDGGPLLQGFPTAGAGDGAAAELILEIYAYAIDSQGGLADTLTQAFRLDLGSYLESLSVGGIRFFGDLDLPPGQYSLRILALQRQFDRLGLSIHPLEVPTWSETTLLPAMRREPAQDAVVVLAAGTDTPPFPVRIEGRPYLPAAGSTMTAVATAPYLLMGRGLKDLRAKLVGMSSEELELGLDNPRPATHGPAEIEILAVEVTGLDFETGDYRLRISTADDAVWVESPLKVRPPGAAAPEVSSPAPAGDLRAASETRQRGRHQALQGAYSRALGFLAGGDQGQAQQAIMELERREIGTGSDNEQTRLADAELRVAVELSSSDVEVLVPIMTLHETLYRKYHRERRYLLATHSRQILIRLAELYLEHSDSPGARPLVADALVSLAGYLMDIGSRMSAENAYQAALDYKGDHQAALIGLAAIRESYGNYESATEVLQKLGSLRPDDLEISLRLAINLARLDEGKRAMKLLQGVLEAPEPSWMGAVAAQELARMYEAKKQTTEATEVLETAIERHPQIQRLRIQLASLLDRNGKTTAARQVLAELDVEAGRNEGSPRLRYSHLPSAALYGARRHLAQEAEHRRAILRTAHDRLGDP